MAGKYLYEIYEEFFIIVLLVYSAALMYRIMKYKERKGSRLIST